MSIDCETCKYFEEQYNPIVKMYPDGPCYIDKTEYLCTYNQFISEDIDYIFELSNECPLKILDEIEKI